MKKFLAIMLVALLGFSYGADAQKRKYNYHNSGYWGNIEAVGGTMLSGGSDIGISTTHGARLGHGLAMGVGVGLYFDLKELYYAFSVPIFLETKYSPFKSGKSPYLSLRTGLSVNNRSYTGFYLSPSIGVDINRLSLFLRYGMNLYPLDVDIEINSPDIEIETTARANVKTHAISVGLAVNF